MDYFVIWEDDTIPAARLAALSKTTGADLKAAMKDLAAMLYAPAAEALLPFLEHDDVQIRHAAAKALGILGNADVAKLLLPYVSNEDVVIAQHCAKSIEAAMPIDLEKKVIRLVKDPTVLPEARFHLVGALQLRGDSNKAANTFLDILEKEVVSGELRNRLGYALGVTTDKKHTKRLIRLFQKEEVPYVTMSLAYALNHATGNRNNLSKKSPIMNSVPGQRSQFSDRWLGK